MHQLERFRIFLVQAYACYATVEDLSEELAQVGTPFVPHPCLGKQPAFASCLEDADAEIDVLSEAHV